MAMNTRSRGLTGSTNRPRLSVRAAYEDFKPRIESKEDAEAHSVYIHLPGFLKEQIRIVAESSRSLLRVRGERLVSGNTWNRFQEEVTVPEICDITETRAKFEGGVLRITMPKRITSVASPSSSPTELSSEAPTPERSPPARPAVPPPSHAVPTPRPLPTPAEPRPSALRPTKINPEVRRPEILPPPPLRTPAAVPRPESLRPPAEPRVTPRIQPKPRDDAEPIPSLLPHPEAARFTPSIYPKPRENERARFEPSLPMPPPGLLQALPQPDPAMKDPITAERWRTEADPAPIRDPIVPERRRNESDQVPNRDPIASERWRNELDQAPKRDPIASERWRNESDQVPKRDPIASERWRNESDQAPKRDAIVQERRRTESDSAPMKDPIDLKRRRIESETPAPLMTPVTSTIADSTGKAPMRYESLTEEEKRRFGMRGMSLRGLDEDRKLLVNMGVAVLVLVSFGAWISYSLGASSNQ